MAKIRLGLTPYLNVKPIIHPLVTGQVKHNFELYFATPSQLSCALKQGELDAGLTPSFEYLTLSDYLILPDMSISSQGAVQSVLLCANKPIREIKTVALDNASRTSASLVKIILTHYLKEPPQYIEAAPPLTDMLKIADAALIIADNALQVPPGAYYTLDLGEEWMRLTGLPFVFAFFVGRQSEHLEEICQVLLQAKALGMKEIPEIARQEALRLNLNYTVCLDYLSRRICYDFSPDKIQGVERFYKLARENNLSDKSVKLKFYQPVNL